MQNVFTKFLTSKLDGRKIFHKVVTDVEVDNNRETWFSGSSRSSWSAWLSGRTSVSGQHSFVVLRRPALDL